jgi:hypothetical protein
VTKIVDPFRRTLLNVAESNRTTFVPVDVMTPLYPERLPVPKARE